MGDFKYRTTKRDAYCRICNKTILKDQEKVINFEFSRQKYFVFICDNCVNKMYDLVKGEV